MKTLINQAGRPVLNIDNYSFLALITFEADKRYLEARGVKDDPCQLPWTVTYEDEGQEDSLGDVLQYYLDKPKTISVKKTKRKIVILSTSVLREYKNSYRILREFKDDGGFVIKSEEETISKDLIKDIDLEYDHILDLCPLHF